MTVAKQNTVAMTVFHTHKALKPVASLEAVCSHELLAVQVCFELLIIIYPGRLVPQALLESFLNNH